ncbi:DUF456 family protein [Oscillatoria laete-virens NRMC-F 0139]|nr:DUF456 family protein [Oscillatoria laete-virens]MDL5052250.1 DUF456 family protein [Oscillatoria laete-virens NRMC-F 0139]
MNITILYWVLVLVMLVGIVGAVVPGIPGSSLILGAILVWGFVRGFDAIGWALGTTLVILLLSVGVDFLAMHLGAQRAGASKWGQFGAIIGLVLGFLGLLPAFLVAGPLIGILVGPIVGAFIGEFLYRRNLPLEERAKTSFKASVGILVGSLVGNLIQGLLAIAAVVVFIATTWSTVG